MQSKNITYTAPILTLTDSDGRVTEYIVSITGNRLWLKTKMDSQQKQLGLVKL